MKHFTRRKKTYNRSKTYKRKSYRNKGKRKSYRNKKIKGGWGLSPFTFPKKDIIVGGWGQVAPI